MTFKNRILEENRYMEKAQDVIDSTGTFAKNNPGVASAIGGAGLGALANYMGDGAESMHVDRKQDTEDWLMGEGRDRMATNNILDKDEFTDLRDKYIDSQRLGIPVGSTLNKTFDWVTGHKEDFDFGQTPEHAKAELELYAKNNPTAEIDLKTHPQTGEPTSMSINGHVLNQNFFNRSDNAYEDYTDSQKLKNTFTNSGDVKNAIESKGNTGLQADLKNLQNAEGDTTSHSYRNSILGGAALGAGGSYAARKIKERHFGN